MTRRPPKHSLRRSAARTARSLPALALALLAGCAGTPLDVETAARRQVAEIGEQYRPDLQKAPLPHLHEQSTPEDYVRFALLNHPQVEASFHEWRAAVEDIAPARSLPDPQFTFEADIADTVMSFMPGFMFDFMTRGKRAAMGREATAASEVAYREYATALYRAAAAAREAWIELAYIDEALRLREASISAIERAASVDASEYATVRGMASLEAQTRFLNDAAQLRATLASLEDRRAAARTRFKAALGLSPDDPDPAWPRFELTASPLPSEAELWAALKQANPELATMRAMVEMAIAGIDVAERARAPDFGFGLMADLKANPLMLRPTANISLPIRRDKIAATIAAAQARRDAAEARLDAEQIAMAAELAQMLYMAREADRMMAYIDDTALPNLDRSIASAAAAYQSGMSGPAMIPQTELMALGMRLERAEALRQRESAVTALMLLTADILPRDEALLSDAAAQR